jgi:hypothetical protein
VTNHFHPVVDRPPANLVAGMSRRWGLKDQERLPRGDAGKPQLAQRLRTKSTLTLRWIAERLRLSHAVHVNQLLFGQ